MVTLLWEGHGGALYRPEDDIVPNVEFPPTVPLTIQVAAVLLVPITVELN
jgi:hypothetical protein